MTAAIGIDLGTSTSCVAVIEGGKPTVISNSEGRNTTPSVVFVENGEVKVGEQANRQRVAKPSNTVVWVKRLMGLDYDKAQEVIPHIAYSVINKGGKPRINIGGKQFSPEEISAQILTKMKKTAEDYLGHEVNDAVITVPAWFDNNAREATQLAGKIAGLNVLRVINEPTSAILAASLNNTEDKNVLVADIGGGTTDFSVCQVSDGMVEVLASRGDVFLGGADFDNAILNWMIKEFNAETGVDLSTDPQAKQRMLDEAEKAKISFSNGSLYEFNIPYITAVNGEPKHFVKSLTKAKFEQITAHLVEKIVAKAKEAMEAAKNPKIDCILLVGGQSRSTAIREALSKEFGVKLEHSVNPDEAVALGASILADTLVNGKDSIGGDILLVDKTSLRFGIETYGGVMTTIIEEDSTMPCKKVENFSTTVDNQTVVEITVLQGNRPLAKDNKEIGRFKLEGIIPAPRGVPRIEVTFDIDTNGVLTVSAKDTGTNKEKHITIQSKSSMTAEEIEKAKRDAAMFAEADKKAKEAADALNNGENALFSSEKSVKENKDNLTESELAEFEAIHKDLKAAIDSKDIQTTISNTERVTNKWQEVSTRIYNQKNEGQTTEQQTEKSDSNVEDATFEEV